MTRILKELDKLDNRFKESIKMSYFKSVKEVGREEMNYINNKMFKKIIITEKITPAWITELLGYYKILYELLDDHNSKIRELSHDTVNLITAALFYFINPYDLLYDVVPDPGYIDDLYILTLCINAVRGEDDKIIKEKFEKLF